MFLEYVAKHNLLKLPYRIDITVDFIHPLVLRIESNKVKDVKPVQNMYEWIIKEGVLVYRADDVNIALLLVWPKRGRRRVYDIYVSERVGTNVYMVVVSLVDLLWIGYEKDYDEIEEILAGKSVKEIRKTLFAYIPPDA